MPARPRRSLKRCERMPELNVLTVASEATPYAKTGGLADVVGALPKELAELGYRVRVFVPLYRSIESSGFPLEPVKVNPVVRIAGRSEVASLECHVDRRTGCEFWFVRNPHYFGRRGLYGAQGTDYDDNDDRFNFLCRATLETVKRLNWRPDVVHLHDWQAGLAATLLKTVYVDDAFFKDSKIVLTVHNLAYQGVFPESRFARLGLPDELFVPTGPIEFYGQVNVLKAAIVFADKITTVSERYAQEIQSDTELGCGLDGVLKERSGNLVGILNGVDYSVWSPSRDRKIPFRYHLANLGGKRKTKIELVNVAGLPVRESVPLVGIISRLVDQKGFDLIAEAADRFFQRDLQLILLGTGEQRYHELFEKLESLYPDKLKAFLKFDDTLAHQIEAGCDVFLMPSRFEPCGLNQMFSMRYGTVPIVHEVGGLADTVTDYNPRTGEGTGFVFRQYTADAMLTAVDRALALFAKKRQWMSLLKAGMRQDFSWGKAARKYAELFESMVGQEVMSH